jgi:hypothetical protein
MHEVPCREAGTPIDLTVLRHVGPPVGWAGLWAHGDATVALRIDGDEQGPYSRLAALAELVLPELDAIERASDRYLREFVRHAENFYVGSWRLRSVRMYWTLDSSLPMGTTFEVTLSITEDDYGEWSVGFIRDTYPANAFRPYSFSRTQR